MRLVLIIGGAWLALTLTGSVTLAFAAIAVGIGSFAVGLLMVMRTKLSRLKSS